MPTRKPKRILDIRALARSHTTVCINSLAGIARAGESEAARVAAATVLLDRGWGKAPVTHTGADGEGDIRVTIRHILEDARELGTGKVIDVVAIAKDKE